MAYHVVLTPTKSSRKSYDIAQCSKHGRVGYMEGSQIGYP